MFGRRKCSENVFTGREVTALILVASLVDFEALGLVPNHETRAVVEKAKSVVTQVETETGFVTKVSNVTIVR